MGKTNRYPRQIHKAEGNKEGRAQKIDCWCESCKIRFCPIVMINIEIQNSSKKLR